MAIYVDADACPVKEEALRVASRHGLKIYYVSNSWMRLPEDPLVERVVVTKAPTRLTIGSPSASVRATSR